MRSLLMLFLLCFSMASSSQTAKMALKSNGFKDGGPVPKIYSCDGGDLSPELEWSGAPENTMSFALICEDPDAPAGTWVHWVIFNIPKTVSSLPRGVSKKPRLENGAVQGINSWPRTGYSGPCPPSGQSHRYFFKIFALDCRLPLDENAAKFELLSAMKGHILATAELMGTYKR